MLLTNSSATISFEYKKKKKDKLSPKMVKLSIQSSNTRKAINNLEDVN